MLSRVQELTALPFCKVLVWTFLKRSRHISFKASTAYFTEEQQQQHTHIHTSGNISSLSPPFLHPLLFLSRFNTLSHLAPTLQHLQHIVAFRMTARENMWGTLAPRVLNAFLHLSFSPPLLRSKLCLTRTQPQENRVRKKRKEKK